MGNHGFLADSPVTTVTAQPEHKLKAHTVCPLQFISPLRRRGVLWSSAGLAPQPCVPPHTSVSWKKTTGENTVTTTVLVVSV